MKINFSQKPKKSLGQNFLIDNNVINKIVEIGEINNNSSVMEIGAGYGSLTKLLVDKKIIHVQYKKKVFNLSKEVYYLNVTHLKKKIPMLGSLPNYLQQVLST